MTTSEDVTQRHHPPIEWVDIHGDGSETPRRGVVWAPAATVSGIGKAWWVLPEPLDAPDAPSEPTALLVAHLAVPQPQETLPGLEEPQEPPRPRTYRPGRVVRARWYAKEGRLVFPGETIRETHSRSVFAVREAAQRAHPTLSAVRTARLSPSAQVELESFLRSAAPHANGVRS